MKAVRERERERQEKEISRSLVHFANACNHQVGSRLELGTQSRSHPGGGQGPNYLGHNCGLRVYKAGSWNQEQCGDSNQAL